MSQIIPFQLPSTAGRQNPSECDPSNYRFLTNIALVDLDRALQAARSAGPAGEFRLVPITCSELGLPLRGAALYVLSHLPESESFWKIYHSLAPRSAA